MARGGLDVVVAGLSVVDLIGKPIDLNRLPKPGGLQMIGSLTMAPGGNVPNVGIDLAKLGFRVGAISRVGADNFGEFLIGELERHGIDASGVLLDADAQTSATFVSVDRSGERSFLHTRGCMARFHDRDVLARISLIGRARWLVFGYLGLLPEIEPRLAAMFRTIRRRTGVRILLDTGGEPGRLSGPSLKRLAESVDCFIPSLSEARMLTGKRTPEEITQFLLAAGTPVAGVKLGSKGCYVGTRSRAAYVRARKVRNVVDTTGAGDAFVAGFVGSLIKGYDVFAAARIANAVAASSITAIGASTAIAKFSTYTRTQARH